MRSTTSLSGLPRLGKPRNSYKFKLVKLKVMSSLKGVKVLLLNGGLPK